MKTLEQLLAQWEAGTLSAEELAELKQLLATPEARARLLEEWQLRESIYDSLRSSPADARETRASAAAQASQAPARQVFKPAATRRRRFPWLVWRETHIALRWPLGVAAAGCLVIVGLLFYYQRAPVGTLSKVGAQVIILHDGTKFTATAGQKLYPGDTVVVPAASSATVAWANEPTELALTGGTELRLHNPIRGKRLTLQSGRLQAAVAVQPRWRPMIIKTPQAQARVVGTHFWLSATGAATRIEVLNGAVLLRKLRPTSADVLREVTVHGGEIATASPTQKLEVHFLTGFLSSDQWSVPPGTPFAEVASKGTWLAPNQAASAGGASRVERLRGYLLAPTTGDYTFWIASFDSSAAAELWLSTDESPAHKRRVAYAAPRPPASQAQPTLKTGTVPGLQLDWQRSPAQKSAPQRLAEGRRYYLEVWHQGTSIGSLALGWRLPGQPSSAQPTMVDIGSLCPFAETAGSGSSAQR